MRWNSNTILWNRVVTPMQVPRKDGKNTISFGGSNAYENRSFAVRDLIESEGKINLENNKVIFTPTCERILSMEQLTNLIS